MELRLRLSIWIFTCFILCQRSYSKGYNDDGEAYEALDDMLDFLVPEDVSSEEISDEYEKKSQKDPNDYGQESDQGVRSRSLKNKQPSDADPDNKNEIDQIDTTTSDASFGPDATTATEPNDLEQMIEDAKERRDKQENAMQDWSEDLRNNKYDGLTLDDISYEDLYSIEEVEKEEILINCTDHKDCEDELETNMFMCIHKKCIKVTKCLTSDSCPMDSECLGGHCIIVDDDEAKDCQNRNECKEGFQCYMRDQVCFYSDCKDDFDRCPGDMTCTEDGCVGQRCLYDNICPDSFTCIYGRCLIKQSISKLSCESHDSCMESHEICNVEDDKCVRYPCSHDSDCPLGTKCHEDRMSKYCSAFTCKSSEDCSSLDDNHLICKHGKCILPKKCDMDSECAAGHLCDQGICSSLKCSIDKDCPSRSRCNESTKFCRNMHCFVQDDCLAAEDCQDNRCVVGSGEHCRHHIHCPQADICQKNICSPKHCECDGDCNDQRLGCHPDGFCTVHEDFIDGVKVSEASRLSKEAGYLLQPETIDTPASDINETQLDEDIERTLAEEMATLPDDDKLMDIANDLYDDLDRQSLRIFGHLDEEAEPDYTNDGRRLKRQARRGRGRNRGRRRGSRGSRDRGRGFRNFGGEGRRRSPRRDRGRRPRGPARGFREGEFAPQRIAGGITDVVPLSEYGEVLQSVSEKIAQHAQLNRRKASDILARKKHSFCRWQTPTSIQRFEYSPTCTDQTWGDPRKYRLISGGCNNLEAGKAHYGLFGLPLGRLLPADYSDGVNKFRLSRLSGEKLPNPRVISNRISFALGQQIQNRKVADDLVNVNFVFFAQFVDHDFTNTFPKPISQSTPVFGNQTSGGNGSLNCCGNQNSQFLETFIPRSPQTRRWCISIKIPNTDPVWQFKPATLRKECLHQQVTRAVPDFECHLGARQILNQVTNWLDLSQIYNSKKEYFDQVNRDPNDQAKLQLDQTDGGKGLMPRCPTTLRPQGSPPTSCATCAFSQQRNPSSTRASCFIGGDFRTDENIALAAHQTLWVREHNRLVDIFRSQNPSLDPETLFQEARRHAIAEYQHIIYNEFLPLLVGQKLMNDMNLRPSRGGYSRQYSPNIDPTIHVLVNS